MWDLSSRPRIEPVPLQWGCRVLTIGPSGKSLPLVLDFDQMKCSLQASKFRSFPHLPSFYKSVSTLQFLGGWIFVSLLLILVYLLSIFLALFLFQLHSTVLCCSSCLSSCHCYHASALCCCCFGEGNGNPLQCSCLENPGDRGAWWAAVSGVAQSRTRLKWLNSRSSSSCFILSLPHWALIFSPFLASHTFFGSWGWPWSLDTLSSCPASLVSVTSWFPSCDWANFCLHWFWFEKEKSHKKKKKRVTRRALGPESTLRLSRGDGGLGRGETGGWKDMDVLGTGELWGSLLLILTCFHKDSSQSFGEGVGLT